MFVEYVCLEFGRCSAWLPAVETVPMPISYAVVSTLAVHVTTPAHKEIHVTQCDKMGHMNMSDMCYQFDFRRWSYFLGTQNAVLIYFLSSWNIINKNFGGWLVRMMSSLSLRSLPFIIFYAFSNTLLIDAISAKVPTCF